MTMSALLGRLATAFFSASMPSGFDPGPANCAWAMCFNLYNTGNATQITSGGFAPFSWPASTAGSINSGLVQGTEASWQRHNVASNAVIRKLRMTAWYYNAKVDMMPS